MHHDSTEEKTEPGVLKPDRDSRRDNGLLEGWLLGLNKPTELLLALRGSCGDASGAQLALEVDTLRLR